MDDVEPASSSVIFNYGLQVTSSELYACGLVSYIAGQHIFSGFLGSESSASCVSQL